MTIDQPLRISLDQLRALRMRAQCLEPRLPRRALVDAVKSVCGINAQLYSAMALSLRARVEGLTLDEVEAARVEDRWLVRTWCMRGTLHLLAATDVDWLLSAIAPGEILGSWRWLERRGGLDRERAQRVLDATYKILKRRGAMTRPELMAALAEEFGAQVKSAAAGLVQLNGALGRVCFGPNAGSLPTYVALEDWLERKVKLTKKPDYAELVRRYLHGYGPAAPRDLAAWWDLGLTIVQAAWDSLETELVRWEVEGQTVSLLSTDLSALAKSVTIVPTVRLLPAFDTYLLGYANRDFAVPPKYRAHVFHGGEIAPTVLVDGGVAGTWRYEPRGREIRIRVTFFVPLKADVRDHIAAEADDIGRFYGLSPALTFSQSD